MDTTRLLPSHPLVNQVIGAVFAILFLKLVPYFSILFRSPTPNEPPNTREDPSSSEFVIGEYDVFLSFHGEDTRNTFVCHLDKELNRKGIRTFIDDKRLKKGKSISPSLIEAIEKSKISIVVFSPNYASSSWCLDELLKIVECKETKRKLVLPVFVNIDPSDVEKQRGTFAKAFRKHWISFVGSDRIQKWRDALSKISTIVGWDSRNCSDGNQAELIQRIVGEVSKSSICTESVPEDPLVGIDSYMMDIDEKLDLKCNDVLMLGIWGPGGIGKTTIAKSIYRKCSGGYDACCFLGEIKDKYKRNGAIALQKELIFHTLSERDLNIWDKNEGCNVIRRLQSKKVLIVLDDVDEQEQLEVLANKVEWFGRGSRIIITTRNKRALIQHGVKNIYELQSLKEDKALELFCLHAFKENKPPLDFLELSNRFVFFTQCLPLALKVLGKSLYERKIDFWQDQLERLKKYPDDKIYQTLKISYDGLDEPDKEVFLDVAFFFDGKAKVEVEDILGQCGFHHQTALPILEERALLTFSFNEYVNFELIHVHDQIKMMGHKIEREESKGDLSRRRRLCDSNEIKDLLTKETGETSIEGIALNMNDLCESMYLKANAFKKMDRLRILKFFKNYEDEKIVRGEIHFLEGFGSLPKGLRYFRWDYFPLKSLPFASFGENLVKLLLRESNMEYLWEGEMEFKNLKKIDLLYNTSLKVFPDLSRAPNIEKIRLEWCRNCYEFPSNLRNLQKLKILNCRYCDKMDKLPMLPQSLVKLYLASGICFLSQIKRPRIQFLKVLKFLIRFMEFSQCIGELKSLKDLVLHGVPFAELPQTIKYLHELESLELQGCTNLVRLPSCMHRLVSLQYIFIDDCRSLVSLSKLPPSLKRLSANFCESLETLEYNNWNHFRQLVELSFVGCSKLDERSRNEIMECARVMSHSYREYRFPSERKENTYIVPRKEIPEWFDYKSC